MDAKLTLKTRKPGRKVASEKERTHTARPAPAKRVKPLAPRQFVDIIEHMSDGVVVLDKDWHYVYVNQKAATMLQRQKPSDLIGKHIWTEYPEGVGQPFHAAYEKAMREQVPVLFEDHYEPWDLWFENRIYPSPDGLLILFTEITNRKRIERLLNERQYFLQKILDTEPGTVYIYDLDERRNVYINRHWLEAFGYTSEETQALGDQLLGTVIHAEDLPRIAAYHEEWRQAGEKDIREIEYRIRTKAGDWCWVHSHDAPFLYDEARRVKQLLGISYEVTPRRAAQEALRQSEQQLGLIYDTVSDLIFLLAVEADERYRFVSVNKAFLQATGLQSEQVIGKYAEEIIPPASYAFVAVQYKKATQEGVPITWEETAEYPAGTKTAIVTVKAAYNDSQVCTHLVGTIHDITDAKQAERALRESEEKFSRVFHASPIPLTITRASDERYVDVNESFLERLGYAREEIIGRSAQEIGLWVSSEDREQLMRLLHQKRSVRNFETKFRTKSGEVGTTLLFRDTIEIGGEAYFIGTSLDISERKQMEEALRDSEKRYQLISTVTSDYMFSSRLDADDQLTLNWVAGAFESITGYTMEEYIAHGGWRSTLHPDDLEIDDRALERLRGNKPVISEVRTFTKDGRLVWVRVYAQPDLNLESQQLVGIYGAVQDITDRKHMEEAILKERDFSDAMLNSLPGAFYLYDRSGKFLRWNRNFEVVSGYSASEIAQMHPLDFFVGEERDLVARRIQQVFESGESQVEADFTTKTRDHIPFFFTGRRIEVDGAPYLLGMGLDITERKRTEQALATSEAEMRALFSAMNDVVMVIDQNGVYRKIAPTNPDLLYKPRQELIGKSMRDIFPAELAKSFVNSVQWVIETQRIAHIEYPLEINGEHLWFDASISPMDAESVLWMARDITGRKRAEEKLRQLNEDLEQRVALRTEELAAAMIRAQESDRLKSAFLASMSHELRTPLNSIIGFTGVLIQGLAGPLNQEQSKQLGMSRDSARHLLALINDVLDISKIEAGQLEILKRPFDMQSAIESALRVVHPLAQKKNLLISTSVGSDVGVINNDRRRVEQVLINLLNNAIKFTERGEIHVSCYIEDGCLETSVQDPGIGIKPENVERLFRPFQQIDTGPARNYEGTGLGLAICKRLVTAMGGEITVESKWGIGSTFTFTLPL